MANVKTSLNIISAVSLFFIPVIPVQKAGKEMEVIFSSRHFSKHFFIAAFNVYRKNTNLIPLLLEENYNIYIKFQITCHLTL